ncbi:MAG: hypothetical protein AAFY71_17880 [Bacteroidota bacterium]
MKKFATITFVAFATLFAMTSCTVEEQVLPTASVEGEREDWEEAYIEAFTEEEAPENGLQKEGATQDANSIDPEQEQHEVELKSDAEEEKFDDQQNPKGTHNHQVEQSTTDKLNQHKELIVVKMAPRVNKTAQQ